MASVKKVAALFFAIQPPIIFASSKVYREQHRPDLPLHTVKDLSGCVVLCTEGTSGIGKATVEILCVLGADVIVASRNREDECKVRTKSETTTTFAGRRALGANNKYHLAHRFVPHPASHPASLLTLLQLDLSDMRSVQRFSSSAAARKPSVVLSCAAEIFTDPESRSVDGYDPTFATSALGLQALLQGLDEGGARPSKVVIIASKLESQGYIDTEVVRLSVGTKLNNREGKFNAVKNYGDAKLCNQLLATELAERWKDTTRS